MTFSTFLTRLRRYWWLIPLFVLLSLVSFLPSLQGNSYISSISVGFQYNNTALPDGGEELTGYTESLEDFSLYLTNRYTAVDIQDVVARALNQSVLYSEVEAFYTVTNQGGGFVNLTYEAASQAQAEEFLDGVKDAYQTIIDEWNSTRLPRFQVTPQTEFVEVITVQEPSPQQLALPIVASLLLGIFVILILPTPNSRK